MVTGLKPGAEGVVEFTDCWRTAKPSGDSTGMVVFVDGPLPGERARMRLTEVKAKYAVGELLELETVSPDRVEPFCPVFGACGGCQVQHLAYPAQLAWKRRIVQDALLPHRRVRRGRRAAADRHGRTARLSQQDGARGRSEGRGTASSDSIARARTSSCRSSSARSCSNARHCDRRADRRRARTGDGARVPRGKARDDAAGLASPQQRALATTERNRPRSPSAPAGSPNGCPASAGSATPTGRPTRTP